MKIISFNINSIRARLHQVQALIDTHQPDIIGLQETKVDDPQFPVAEIEAMGYHVAFHGQKGHYGVALMSKQAPLSIIKGFPEDGEESQRRFITGVFEDAEGREITVMNGYFPQGESRDHEIKFPAKTKFYADLTNWIQQDFKPTDQLVIMGDFNIAPVDNDIGIGPDNAKRWLRSGKCSFLPEEREWFSKLTEWGLIDSFRAQQPETNDRFSWFDYRSKGFAREPKRGLRIDHILLTQPLMDKLVDTGVDYDIRAMDKPSDHAPVWATLK